MTNRQKRLCRALLDFYDASGAQPYPLAQLARKTGYDTSDIYDKDSQSGDLWPFDPKARGNYAGMLGFTGGKNPTVTLTSAGLVALENLCKDEPSLASGKEKVRETPPAKVAAPFPERVSTTPPKPAPAPASKTAKPFAAPAKTVPTTPPVAPAPTKFARSSPKFSTPEVVAVSASFSSDEISEARNHFKYWLKYDPVGQALLENFVGDKLVEAVFEKFFSEFLKGK